MTDELKFTLEKYQQANGRTIRTEPLDACAAAIAGIMSPTQPWERLHDKTKDQYREATRACLDAFEQSFTDDCAYQVLERTELVSVATIWIRQIVTKAIHAITKQENV